jgi:hypothetical protein
MGARSFGLGAAALRKWDDTEVIPPVFSIGVAAPLVCVAFYGSFFNGWEKWLTDQLHSNTFQIVFPPRLFFILIITWLLIVPAHGQIDMGSGIAPLGGGANLGTNRVNMQSIGGFVFPQFFYPTAPARDPAPDRQN